SAAGPSREPDRPRRWSRRGKAWDPFSPPKSCPIEAEMPRLEWYQRPAPGPRPSIQAVVRGFLRDDDVVRVGLADARVGDADEAAVAPERGDVRRAAVAHGRAQATDELVHDVGHRALVRDASLDALGHQLLGRHAVLEVA